jgi:hypothetical protein
MLGKLDFLQGFQPFKVTPGILFEFRVKSTAKMFKPYGFSHFFTTIRFRALELFRSDSLLANLSTAYVEQVQII